jgi:hypothetical protein
MFKQIRNREATKKHNYTRGEKAFVVLESELELIESLVFSIETGEFGDAARTLHTMNPIFEEESNPYNDVR